MRTTPAWNNRVQRNLHEGEEFKHLFQQSTNYQGSPIDGISLLTNNPVSPDFLRLANKYGQPVKVGEDSQYGFGYTFGSVKVLKDPLFRNVPKTKIWINPSEGGLSMPQVHNWVTTIVGTEDDVQVAQLHQKVDLVGVNTTDLSARLWWDERFRKIDDAKWPNVYLGGAKSRWQLLAYDKALEMEVQGDHTRIEVRRRYDKDERFGIADLEAELRLSNPFDKVYLVNANDAILADYLRSLKVSTGKDYLVKKLRGLEYHKRLSLLNKLRNDGFMTCHGPQYNLNMHDWLFTVHNSGRRRLVVPAKLHA